MNTWEPLLNLRAKTQLFLLGLPLLSALVPSSFLTHIPIQQNHYLGISPFSQICVLCSIHHHLTYYMSVCSYVCYLSQNLSSKRPKILSRYFTISTVCGT